ncbi:ADYC domain-containing protein [Paraliomyxa miuraensis]|uniref:ADYC domain-containing protein n=1 Tax=Paraliomyxa miuraensis TaxID=376150 RepID=UPI00224DFD48|nr:ADYC domain-containing protein [Paraliomyxa miuraensis]MCX4246231.1 ADYC domain-containing protein [Paraliomyxa miuraensis]
MTFRSVVSNDVMNNGFQWNGFQWNGFQWNGFQWNGFQWNSAELNSTPMFAVAYDSTNGSLEGEDGSTNPLSLEPGDTLLLVGEYTDGTVIEATVSEVEQITEGPHDYQFHRVQTRTRESADPEVWGAWEDACRDGAGNPVKAILLQGDWTWPTYSRYTGPGADTATTWACRGAALAKCVEWGYHPEGVVNSTSLQDHHQACTRMVRADYCGDGEHHTENGTLIDVEDSLGIETHESSWDIEAAWGTDGALCLNTPRKTYWSRTDALTECSSVPSCDANSNDDLTDDTAYWMGQGALFVTRSEPSALLVEPPAPPYGG